MAMVMAKAMALRLSLPARAIVMAFIYVETQSFAFKELTEVLSSFVFNDFQTKFPDYFYDR